MSAAMDEQQMLLIMKYYDGECSEVEVLHAERLLREGDDLNTVLKNYSALGEMVEEWGHTVQSRTTWVPDVEAIMLAVDSRRNYSVGASATSIGKEASRANASVSTSISTSMVRRHLTSCGTLFERLWEKRNSDDVSHRSNNRRGLEFLRGHFWQGLGWASSGVLVAASCILLFGISGEPPYFNRNIATPGSADITVVSGGGGLTGGDKGHVSTSFVSESNSPSKIILPVVAQTVIEPWSRTDSLPSFEEMKDAKKEKARLDEKADKLQK